MNLNNVQAVKKHFATAKQAVYPSDLSADLDIPLDEVHNILQFLEKQGYVKKGESIRTHWDMHPIN